MNCPPKPEISCRARPDPPQTAISSVRAGGFFPSASPSQWEPLEEINPFFSFGRFPNHQQFLNRSADRHVLRKDEDAGAVLLGDEVGEVGRHRAAVVRDQKATFPGGKGQNLWVRQAANAGFIGGLKINSGLVTAQGLNDGLAEISVSLKLDLHWGVSSGSAAGAAFCCLAAINLA